MTDNQTPTGPFSYEVRDIGKSYGSVVALEGVSLGVRTGEVIGLVGDNEAASRPW